MPAPDPTPRPLDHLAECGRDDAPALVLRERTLSWKDLRTGVAQLAGWLAKRVPERGARVATWAAKGELACLMPLAAARAGLVHVPINPLLKRAQAAHILADSGASLLVATPARLATLEASDVPEPCEAVAEDAALEAAARCDGLPASDADPGALAAFVFMGSYGALAAIPAVLAGGALAAGEMALLVRWLGRVYARTEPSDVSA